MYVCWMFEVIMGVALGC